MNMNLITIDTYIILATVLFCIGVLGVLIRRNMIVILMSVEIMLNAANLLLTAFSSFRNDAAGQVLFFSSWWSPPPKWRSDLPSWS